MAAVLIVEDQPLIAEDVADCLYEMGHKVAGIAASCPHALEVLSATRPDVALLDTQLIDETCEAVLNECDRLGVPVIITSGYPRTLLPGFCQGRPYVGKPIDYELLKSMLMTIPLKQANLLSSIQN